MSTQGSAQAPERTYTENEHTDSVCGAPPRFNSAWNLWKQIIIGEILIVLEPHRCDNIQPR